MQTVLHRKNSNKEGHICHLLTERESQEDDERWHKTWLTLNLQLIVVSVGAARVATFFASCSPASCHISHVLVVAVLLRSIGICVDAEIGVNCRTVTCKVTWGEKLLSNGVCWSVALIELGGGYFCWWCLSIKQMDGCQHRGSQW